MDKLVTATGKEFECDYFNPFLPDKECGIRILNESISKIASIFSNPEETIQLRCGSRQVDRYTRLSAIINEDGAIRVVLEKE